VVVVDDEVSELAVSDRALFIVADRAPAVLRFEDRLVLFEGDAVAGAQ
jgi:hypothetical protein